MASTKQDNPQTNPVPTAPKPQNSYYYENGVLKSSTVQGTGSQKGMVTNTYSTPTEQGIQNNANDYMGQLVSQLPNAVNLSPEAIKGYTDAYAAPQINALNQSYDTAKGQATQAATAHGVQNSVGFGDYTANTLEKNRAQGLADIQSNATLEGLDIPNQLLSPYVNQFNLYTAAANGQQATLQQNQQLANQGTGIANNSANQSFQSQLAQQAALSQQIALGNRSGLGGFFSGGT